MKYSTKLKEIEHIILRNYTKSDFCVDKLSEILGLSTSYLRELFYKHYSCCPQRYIENTRLEHAIKVLSADISLYELSSMAGFCDAGALRRSIKKRFNMMPSTLKEKLNVSHYNILHLKQSLIEGLWNQKPRTKG